MRSAAGRSRSTVVFSAAVVSDRAACSALASADRALTPERVSDTSDTTVSSWRRRSLSVTGRPPVRPRMASVRAPQSSSRPLTSLAAARAFRSPCSWLHFPASARSWAIWAETRCPPDRAESSSLSASEVRRLLSRPISAAAAVSCCCTSGSSALSCISSRRSSARSTLASAVYSACCSSAAVASSSEPEGRFLLMSAMAAARASASAEEMPLPPAARKASIIPRQPVSTSCA